MSALITGCCYKVPEKYAQLPLDFDPNLQYEFGELINDPKSPFHPKKNDSKIMRKDEIASVIALREMFKKLNLCEQAMKDIDLYVANGVFLEDSNKYLTKISNNFKDNPSMANNPMEAIYKYTPPLLALETLTNSTMSLIAQYLKIAGYNATFGNTSTSGFYALEEAFLNISQSRSKMAIAGGSNCGGLYSLLMFRNFFENAPNWKESAACAYLLIEKEGCRDESRTPLANITAMYSSTEISFFNTTKKTLNIARFLDENQVNSHIIFTGALTSNLNEKLVNQLNKNHSITNLYNYYGNSGVSGIYLGVIEAIKSFKNNDYSQLSVIDIDPYGRFSGINLEHVEH